MQLASRAAYINTVQTNSHALETHRYYSDTLGNNLQSSSASCQIHRITNERQQQLLPVSYQQIQDVAGLGTAESLNRRSSSTEEERQDSRSSSRRRREAEMRLSRESRAVLAGSPASTCSSGAWMKERGSWSRGKGDGGAGLNGRGSCSVASETHER